MRGGYGLAEWRSKEEVVVPWASSLGPAAGGVEGEGDGGRPSARQRIGEDEKWRRRALVFIAWHETVPKQVQVNFS